MLDCSPSCVFTRLSAAALALAAFAAAAPPAAAADPPGTVVEYPIRYPNRQPAATSACHPAQPGSTHEIAFDPNGGTDLWITGQKYDQVVRVSESGETTFYPMPAGSGPHGIEFDAEGRLWVSLEFSGHVVRLDENGKIAQTIDVGLACPTCPDGRLNPHPHGLGFGSDGRTIWFTGKSTGTVGRIAPDGTITTFPLPTIGSVPIYVRAGNDGTMWVTELVGNKIARITPDGAVAEFAIPTWNSRPIAIVPEPGSNAMWLSEEAGNRVARIASDGTIVELPLPRTQANVIVAGLAFDAQGNLWVQQYVDQNAPTPAAPSPPGKDFIVRVGKEVLSAPPGDFSRVPITWYGVPTAQTVMHRIVQGPDGNIWFTELAADQVGKLTIAPPGD